MLESIKQALFGIADFFEGVGGFIVSFIKETTAFISRVPEAVDEASDVALFFLPDELIATFTVLISVVVALRVVGRL